MKKIFAVAMATVLLPSALAAQTADLERAAATITQDDYAWRIGVIAHDSMQGRNTPSVGLDRTAEWIASEFRRLGLRGGAEDGGFIQRYPLDQIVLDMDGSTVTLAGGEALLFGRDLLPVRGAGAASVSGGLMVITGDVDAESLGGTDVRGRHVVLVLPPETLASRRAYSAAMGVVADAGAASVWVASDADDATWSSMSAQAERPSVQWPTEEGMERPAATPRLQIRASSLTRVLRAAGVGPVGQAKVGGAVVAHDVPGAQATLEIQVDDAPTSAPNVVGILEGSDPALKDEYVVFSGHMDHVGMGTPDENGDSIFNGADDDASGTVAVMEVAEAMASLEVAPRRSMIFVLVSGEEKGLWGSRYYADHPSVPVGQLVANLNADMVGRNWPDTIVAIGKEHSDLGETLNRVNGAHPELRMTAIDDIWPEQRFYFRSDHFNFARKGVPILFFFNGTHPDYHGRDDEPDRIDTEKAARISRLLFYLGVDVANADERPRWNPESYKAIVSAGN
jgi:Zn-dependent M28 family amino/carboxypeptidase